MLVWCKTKLQTVLLHWTIWKLVVENSHVWILDGNSHSVKFLSTVVMGVGCFFGWKSLKATIARVSHGGGFNNGLRSWWNRDSVSTFHTGLRMSTFLKTVWFTCWALFPVSSAPDQPVGLHNSQTWQKGNRNRECHSCYGTCEPQSVMWSSSVLRTTHI